MTGIYDIIETFVGTPGDAYQTALLYMMACILLFILVFGIFDLMYIMFTGWWGR